VPLFRRDRPDDTADPDDEPELAGSARPAAAALDEGGRRADSGPWDVGDEVAPDVPRIDFGPLRVPGVDGMAVRLDGDESGTLVSVTVLLDETELQISAFAAPRSSGLWDEVRAELAATIEDSGGTVAEEIGRFGPELVADVPVTTTDGTTKLERLRFLGADGSRWFVRGLVSGAGADDRPRALAAEDVFADLVVVRGDHPAAPRDLLPLQVPPDAPISDDAVPDAD
jgi:hypothetical protein